MNAVPVSSDARVIESGGTPGVEIVLKTVRLPKFAGCADQRMW
jgi:hypothetical protein